MVNLPHLAPAKQFLDFETVGDDLVLSSSFSST
jgi:hypothetical protein